MSGIIASHRGAPTVGKAKNVNQASLQAIYRAGMSELADTADSKADPDYHLSTVTKQDSFIAADAGNTSEWPMFRPVTPVLPVLAKHCSTVEETFWILRLPTTDRRSYCGFHRRE
jgi:hypothetical protein